MLKYGLDRYFVVNFFNDNVNSENYINDILLAIAQVNTVDIVYPSAEPISLHADNQTNMISHETLSPSEMTGDKAASPLTSFRPIQHYLWPAKHFFENFKLGGIDGIAGSAYEGGKGENVTIISNEPDAWFNEHINLPHERALVEGEIIIGSHNTSAVGIMAGLNLGYGILGIVPNAKMGYSSPGVQHLYNLYHRLNAGDVIQIGMQHHGILMAQGEKPCSLPVEFEAAWFDIISALTDKGIHVIEAAGHGAFNLDHPVLKGKYDRGRRDSGAIMVGALDPRTGLKTPLSNFGSRVDSSSWGAFVATTSYGHATLFNQTNAWYINDFSGINAANPIIAGAAACLSSIAAAYNAALSPQRLRELLTGTGTVLAQNNSALMGTQPDLSKAIYAMFAQPDGSKT
ncbi:hypothetical protein ACL2XP_21710 [Sodalis sp. RH21]|uniref:hypothetical protein n=1 Tax=unclassified Sodalis (in: enterobacteria) TaxID=2636512 RepID=UPI0039B4BE8B